jgi:hypothetical protein
MDPANASGLDLPNAVDVVISSVCETAVASRA